jgi:hypothetical protein
MLGPWRIFNLPPSSVLTTPCIFWLLGVYVGEFEAGVIVIEETLSPAALTSGVVGVGVGEGEPGDLVGVLDEVGVGVSVGSKLTAVGGESPTDRLTAEATQMKRESKIRAIPPNM